MSNKELLTALYEDTPNAKACNIVFRMTLAEILPVNETPMTVTEITKLFNQEASTDVTVQKINANLTRLCWAGIVERKEISRKVNRVRLVKRAANGKWIPVVDEVKVKRYPVFCRIK